MAASTKLTARRVASKRLRPCATPVAAADASAQPVPWVWAVSIRGRGAPSARAPSLSTSQSCSIAPGRWPDLTSTCSAPSPTSVSPARNAWSIFAMLRPTSASASGIFGVSSCARGTSRSRSRPTASGSISGAPPLARITGSIISGTFAPLSSSAATRSITSALCSIPILMASTAISDCTTAICWAMKSSGTGMTA